MDGCLWAGFSLRVHGSGPFFCMIPRRVKWVILLLAVALVMVILFSRSREPSFEGRTLSEWLSTLLAQSQSSKSSPGQFDEQTSVKAIRSMGTNALPLLVDWVCFNPSNSPVRTAIRTSAAKVPTAVTPRGVRIWLANQGPLGRRLQAAIAFAALGDQAEAAIPELTRSMNQADDFHTRLRAMIALAGIGTPQALTNLMANARSTNASTCQMVYDTLCFTLPLRANDDLLVPFLVTALRESPQELKPEIIKTIGYVNPTNLANVDILVQALSAEIPTRTFEDLDAAIRAALRNPGFTSPSWSEGAGAAAFAIGRFGERARPAVPVLRSAATNYFDANLRTNALKSLHEIESTAITNLPAW